MNGSESLQNDQSTASENALRRAVDTTPAFIHTARPDGYIDYYNRGWLDCLGKSLDDVCGWRWTEAFHPDDVAAIVQKWHAALASGEPFEIETRVRRADGSYRALLHRKLPLRDEHGNIVKWFGSSIDIEDRKCAEEQLRRNAQQLQRSEFYLSEGQRLSHTGSWAFDSAGFDYWSPELFRIYGLDPASEAPTIQEYLNCIHPEDREFMANLIKRVLVDASGFDTTKRIVRPDGEVRYVRCVGAPLIENQSLKKYVGTAVDVTEQEIAAQELRRREAYREQAEALSHTGSFGWNVSTRELVWSSENFRILGYEPTVKPTLKLALKRIHPEDLSFVQRMMEQAKSGTNLELEHRLLMPDGQVKHVHVIARPLTNESGELEYVASVMDVTARKKAFEEIKTLRDELQRENVVLREELGKTSMFEEVIGTSSA